MSGVHVARQGFVTKATPPSLARQRGPIAYACSLLINGNGADGAQNPTVPTDLTGTRAFSRALAPITVNISPYASGGSTYNEQYNNNAARMGFYATAVPITTGEFCIEYWCKPNTIASSQDAITNRAWQTGYNRGWAITHSNTGKVLLTASQGAWNSFPTIYTSAGSLTANVWNHVALVRDASNVIKLFINGVQDATTVTYAGSLDQTSGGGIGNWFFVIGNGYGDGQFQPLPFQGYIGDVRIGTGTGSAIYTANFTPPTSTLTPTTGTVVAVRFLGFINDSSANNVVMTAFNSASQSALSPFASPYFGSLVFNGAASSYVGAATASSALFTFGTGDFTIECWFRSNSFSSEGFLYDGRNGGSGAFPTLYINTSGVLSYHVQNADRISTSTLSTNTWYHVAVTRSGTSTRMFLNGVQVGSTYTDTTNYSNTTARPIIGVSGFTPSSNSMNGYISNLRVVKGTALYTAGFTPSTTPLTAVSGTSLLLLNNNIGISDSSANGYAVSVFGNAKISTTQSKFGGSSISLDGTGDYLTVANATPLQFTVPMFHIECWIYRNATGVVHTLACKGSSTSGWLLQINASDKLTFVTNTSTVSLTSTTSIAANTWTHVAVTRDGSNMMRMFINGVQESSSSNSISFSQSEVLVIGADRSYTNFFNGFIEDLRLFRDGAKYISTFTAPATELQATDDVYRYFTNAVYGVYQLA